MKLRAFGPLLGLPALGFGLPKPPGAGVGYFIFGFVYATIAVGVSSGAAYALRTELT